ncbi:hypothetical protein BGZ73_008635, partial [Actinomortierella ambigua]
LALIGNSWKFDKIPSGGLLDVTFPFNLANAPRQRGYYFAQQFNFFGIPEVGYTGLQPQSDFNGKSMLRAVFSSFQKHTTTTHHNCHLGADGGPGVSCGVYFYADYSHTFNMVVERVKGTTWRGTVVDTVTNGTIVVGEWTLPSTSTGIKKSQLGFVEYFLWNDGKPSHDCTKLPFTEATFYHPTSRSVNATGGQIDSVYAYGECVGESDFQLSQVNNGYDIRVGFQ